MDPDTRMKLNRMESAILAIKDERLRNSLLDLFLDLRAALIWNPRNRKNVDSTSRYPLT